MKFNFTSQICTTTEQSAQLLALGLKKETADMHYPTISEDEHTIRACWEDFWDSRKAIDGYIRRRCTPAWSLHRLIEMMPDMITHDACSLMLGVNATCVYYADGEYAEAFKAFEGNLYECVVKCIEWLIKEGYFNKEYLVE